MHLLQSKQDQPRPTQPIATCNVLYSQIMNKPGMEIAVGGGGGGGVRELHSSTAF